MMSGMFGINLSKVKRYRPYRALIKYINSISQGFVALRPVLLPVGALPLIFLIPAHQNII